MPKYFIALVPSEQDATMLADLAWELPEEWVPTQEADMHLTALYLGEAEEQVRPHIETILANIVRTQRHFYFRGGRIVVMQPDEPYMVWVRWDEDKALTALVRELEQRFVKIGTWRPEGQARYKFGNKAPLPHVTLGRAAGGRLADSLIAPLALPSSLKSMHFRSIGLYETRPGTKEGEQKYSLLRSWDLLD